MSEEPAIKKTSSRLASPAAMTVMLLAVMICYQSPKLFGGNWRVFGIDYVTLHERRIAFALEQIGEHGTIPAWYPRELMGSPFWSNVQSFPFIPTRLLLLPAGSASLFTISVWMNAALAALLTFTFARMIGQGRIAAAGTGFAFACCGFFASRVLAGQLGMLEGYPSLPALLCAIEWIGSAANHRQRALRLAALALGVACFALSAHPQLPIYSMAAAGAYALWRLRRMQLVQALGAMGLGIGLAGFALWPMVQLIGRSSRVLDMDPPVNDIVLEYARLPSLFLPWIDGAPDPVLRPSGVNTFSLRYSSFAHYWDTVNYIGWMPWIAVIVLLLYWMGAPKRIKSHAAFLLLMSLTALLLALPLLRDLQQTPFIILRSPARLMYLVNFGLAMSLGGAISLALRHRNRFALLWRVAVAAALCWHVVDQYRFNRSFILEHELVPEPPGLGNAVAQTVGDHRTAMDINLELPVNRRFDDLGFFDSIMLGNSYRGLMALAGLPPRSNFQELDAGQLDFRALRACGVRLIITLSPRRDVRYNRMIGNLLIYIVPNPAPRAQFFPSGSEIVLDSASTLAALSGQTDVASQLILSNQATPLETPGNDGAIASPHALRFSRPRPDRFEFELNSSVMGFVRVLEAFDPGWRATIDGSPAPVLEAHGMAMAVAVPSGKHELKIEYFTPGRTAGLAVSAGSALLLAALCFLSSGRILSFVKTVS